jgi:lipopolysaccharide export system permease protein
MRLWRYVVSEHIGPFFFGLFVSTFVLIIDFIPRVLEMVVGRDIPAAMVARLFMYNLAWMLALAVPMAALVAPLMAFGRFSADNEIVAFKASGINPLRLIMPVLIASAGVGLALIWFNNHVLPESNHSARLLMSQINRTRPTLQIKDNVFVGSIPGYYLLVQWRDPRGNDLRGVTIYDQTDSRWPRTVTGATGKMRFTPDGNTLIMELENGEVHEYVGAEGSYRRTRFVAQTFFLPGAGGAAPTAQTNFRTDREKSTAVMMQDIRGWKKNLAGYQVELDSISRETVLASLIPHAGVRQPIMKAHQTSALRLRGQILSQRRLINSMMIEVHKKYSIPAACVVFVLIGAPLGILARRGGLAISLGLSLGLFIVYWASLIGGEELADRLYVNAFWAMWTANFLIGGVGIGLMVAVVRERRPVDWWRRLRYRKVISTRK